VSSTFITLNPTFYRVSRFKKFMLYNYTTWVMYFKSSTLQRQELPCIFWWNTPFWCSK